jgi:hypothetical protein
MSTVRALNHDHYKQDYCEEDRSHSYFGAFGLYFFQNDGEFAGLEDYNKAVVY